MTLTRFDESGLAAIYPGAWARVQAEAAARGAEPRAAARTTAASPDGIAILQVHGVITQRASVFSELFGGTGLDQLQAALAQLRDDRTIQSIVLHINSPGGGVYGVDEAAEMIADVGKRKRIVAFTDGMCASAAYWLASACSRIVATTSAELGSVGVYAIHMDHSGELASAGIVPTLVRAGEFKAESNPYQPLSAEDKAAMQARVDAYYSLFTHRVAKGRGVSVEAVRGDVFGAGRVMGAPEAVAAGMVDEIGSFLDVLRGMTRETSTRAALAADALLAYQVRAASVA